MKSKRHFKQSKEQKIAAQEIPKYILSAFNGLPYGKCLTHIVVESEPSKAPLAQTSSPSEQKE